MSAFSRTSVQNTQEFILIEIITIEGETTIPHLIRPRWHDALPQ
jgi:hypothetical protein